MIILVIFGCYFISAVSGSDLSETADITESRTSFSARIVGGATAFKGELPYQVSLKTVLFRKHFCGAFIITENWIGTAAHCTINRAPWGQVAVVGAVSSTSEGTSIRLQKFVNHPEYNNKNLKNDISLIKTAEKIEFSPTIQPIQLGSYFVDEANSAIISGWGYTTNPGVASPFLQWISVRTLSNEDCKAKMSRSNAEKVFDSSLCAEPVSAGGSCMGDSGGPMVGPHGALIGIISWGVPCSMGYPDVYTRITSYESWINSVLDF